VSSERPSDPQYPPQPPPGASPEEWRDWRGQQRYQSWGGNWAGNWGGSRAWFWGVVLILVGGYALLRSLGLLQWIRVDIFWPLLVIALGVWLIIERAIPRQPRS
jgi:Domain of unknown function (DUF5668)